jgi:hypothetical protein
MFVGHFALGFAAKRYAPRVSLAMLFVAAQLADLLWPVLIATGVEQVRIEPGNTAFTPLAFVSYPYSHSLLMLAIWGLVLAAAYRAAGGSSRALIVLPLLVVSHWVLDWIVHRPDLPLVPGGAKYGLGLWNSPVAAVTVELVMFAAGAAIYLASTRARDRVGRWGAVALVAILLLVYFASAMGPPPPSVMALAVSAMMGGAVIAWLAWWVDRHRTPTSA